MVPKALVDKLDGRAGRSLVVKAGRGKVVPHDLYLLPGLGCQVRFVSFVNSVVNARTALLERVFYHEIDGVFSAPRSPGKAAVWRLLGGFKGAVRARAVSLTPVPLVDYAKSVYSGRRLRVYLAATEKLLARGVLPTDAIIRAFLKHEKLQEKHGKRLVPRLIQPRSPVYNVAVGRYLHQLEHVVYRDIDAIFGAPVVMKGYNAFQVGEMMHEAWIQFNNPCALGLDAKRFDQHITVDLLEWEHGIYDLYYHSLELCWLLLMQLTTKGYLQCGDGELAYKVAGGRCSGDMNTAMGNVLIMCAGVHSLLSSLGMGKVGRAKIRVFNNGDDCMLIGERADIFLLAGHVEEHFAKLGLIMTIEPVVFELEEVSFCQTQPIFDGARWRMVRDVRVSLTKDATMLSLRYVTELLRYQLAAIGNCGLALTGGLPILQEYYSAMLRNGDSSVRADERFYSTGFYRMSRGLSPYVTPVTAEARVSFARAFGIVPDLQIQLERYYRNWNLPPGPVTLEEVSRIFLN